MNQLIKIILIMRFPMKIIKSLWIRAMKRTESKKEKFPSNSIKGRKRKST